MRPAPWDHLERYRYMGPPGEPFGAFQVKHPPTSGVLRMIVSSDGWEHLSVSLKNRTPTWAEMEFACRLFWDEEEAVMQLHPPRSQWVSNHPFCLHIWKPPADQPIPLPPSIMVGVQGLDLSDPKIRAAAIAEYRTLTGG